VRHVVVGVLAVAVALVAVPPLAADIRARQAEIAARRHPTSPDATRKARSAMRLDPPEATFPAVLGDVNERKAAAESAPDAKSAAYAVARAAYAKALRMRPGHIYYMVSVARVDTSWATDVDPTRFPEADASWTAVVTFDPTDWEVHNLYAAMLNSWSNASGGDVGLRLRAVGELREVVHIQPLNVDAWVNLGKLQLAAGDTAQARASLEHSLALRPTDADAKSLLATLPPGPPPAGQ
jgi:cytochrome c-type biogenesis protein CcmH/NrfG